LIFAMNREVENADQILTGAPPHSKKDMVASWPRERRHAH
jgi:hypothetical protein